MKKQIIVNLIIVNILLILAYNMESINSASPEIIILDDFNEFDLLDDSLSIISENSEDYLSFNYSGGAAERVEEYYIYNLGDCRYCTSFKIEINLEYNYTGSMLSGGLCLLGSYYFENGTYFGKPQEQLYSYLGWTSIRDSQIINDGLFEVCGYPYNNMEKNQSSYGSLGSEGNATFILKRENSELNLEVKKDSESMINNTWDAGVSRQLNYILIGLTIISPADIDLSFVKMTSINGNLTVLMNTADYCTTVLIPGFVFGTSIISLLIVKMSIYFNRAKRIICC